MTAGDTPRRGIIEQGAAARTCPDEAGWHEVVIDSDQAAAAGGQLVTLGDGTELRITAGPQQTPEEAEAARLQSIADGEAYFATPEGLALFERLRPEMEGQIRVLQAVFAERQAQVTRPNSPDGRGE